MSEPLTKDEEARLREATCARPVVVEVDRLLATLDAERAKVARLREALTCIERNLCDDDEREACLGDVARAAIAETEGKS